MALDEYGDIRIAGTADQIAFPVPRYRSILGFGRSLADRDGINDLAAPLPRVVAFAERRIMRRVRRCLTSSLRSTPRAWIRRLR